MADQLDLWPDDAPGSPLRWSLSRDRRLSDCARKYYLFHHQARGGWLPDAKPEQRQAFVLRGLRSRFMWVGEVVHEMLELLLTTWRRGESVDIDSLVERGTRRMRAQYAESLQGIYWDRPRTACGLVEHEYREVVSREEWQLQRERMEKCLRSFARLPVAETIRSMPHWRWLALESMTTFDLDGATVAVKPDFAWRDARGLVRIFDWKTGKPRPDDERLQLAVYGLYARKHWGVTDDGLFAVSVHLDTESGTADLHERAITPADLRDAEATIRSSVARMRELEGGVIEAKRFPQTPDVKRCTYCSFRRLCARG